MKRNRTDSAASITVLNTPESIQEDYHALRAMKIGEVKKMLAWWDGASVRYSKSMQALGRLPSIPKITTQVSWENGLEYETSLVPQTPPVALWCVTLNQGDGFRALPDTILGISHTLQSWMKGTEPDSLQSKGQYLDPHSPQSHLSWISAQFTALCESCEGIALVNAPFRAAWEEHRKDIQSGGWKAQQVPHPPSIALACQAFDALLRVKSELTKGFQRALDYSAGKPPLIPFRPLVFRLASCAHHAGKQAKALADIAASYRTLSTLGAAKNTTRREDSRTLFIRELDNEVRARLGRKPSALDVMRELDGKIDPNKGQKILFGTDEDGAGQELPYIQWHDHEKQSLPAFKTKLSGIRKKTKN